MPKSPPRVLHDVSNRRKWTDAIEMVHMELDGVEPWNQKSMDFVRSHLVCGEVRHVRHYPETSPEEDVFLHGVDAWDLTLVFLPALICLTNTRPSASSGAGPLFPPKAAMSGWKSVESGAVAQGVPLSTASITQTIRPLSKSLMNHIILDLID